MVLSIIDDSVSYKETLKIKNTDKGKEISPFKSEIKDIPVIIGLGEVNNTYIDKKISYCYLYLILDFEKIICIGVYEFLAEKFHELLDEDNDLDISLLDEPLLFSFVNKEFIKNKMDGNTFIHNFDTDEEGDTDSDDDDSMDDSVSDDDDEKFVDKDELVEEDVDTELIEYSSNIMNILKDLNLEDNIKPPEKISIETMNNNRDMYNQEIREYEPPLNIGLSAWIQKYMKNNNYKVVDKGGDGDCFFLTIESAFKEIGKTVTVEKMRNIVADNADNDKFETYRDFYNSFKTTIQEIRNTIKKLKTSAKELKNKYEYLIQIIKSDEVEFKKKKL